MSTTAKEAERNENLWHYIYNRAGRLEGLRNTVLDESCATSVCLFDPMGRKRREYFYNYGELASDCEYSYNDQGLLIRKTINYNDDYSFPGEMPNFDDIDRTKPTPPFKISYIYNEAGQLVRQYVKRLYTLYSYSEDKSTQHVWSVTRRGIIDYSYSVRYNARGEEIERISPNFNREVSVYDARGLIQEVHISWQDENLTCDSYFYKYRYDKHGNWTKRWCYFVQQASTARPKTRPKRKLIELRTRAITYYDTTTD